MRPVRFITPWPTSIIQWLESEQAINRALQSAAIRSVTQVARDTQVPPDRILRAITSALYVSGWQLQSIADAMLVWAGTGITALQIEEIVTTLQSQWNTSDTNDTPVVWLQTVEVLNTILRTYHRMAYDRPRLEMPPVVCHAA